MKFKTIVKPILNWLWQVSPWLIDRITGKPRSPQEMREELERAEDRAEADVKRAIDKKFN